MTIQVIDVLYWVCASVYILGFLNSLQFRARDYELRGKIALISARVILLGGGIAMVLLAVL
jgi:hypothetical protein